MPSGPSSAPATPHPQERLSGLAAALYRLRLLALCWRGESRCPTAVLARLPARLHARCPPLVDGGASSSATTRPLHLACPLMVLRSPDGATGLRLWTAHARLLGERQAWRELLHELQAEHK